MTRSGSPQNLETDLLQRRSSTAAVHCGTDVRLAGARVETGMTLLLAIDGGGTRTRCIAVDRDGGIRGQGEAGPSNHLHVPIDLATAALRSRNRRGAVGVRRGRRGSSRSSRQVSPESISMARARQKAPGCCGRSDSIALPSTATWSSHIAAHWQARLASWRSAGTGSSVLGIGNDGTMIKAGGWGPLYGDGGSAYQLGRLGLAAAAEAYDASGPMTSLSAAAPDRARSSRIPRHGEAALFGSVRCSCMSRRWRQSWTRAPKRETRSQPESAGRPGSISRGLVMAVIHRVPLREKLVSYQGGVLRRSRLVRAAFVDALTADRTEIEVRPPRLDPIFGAVLLGARGGGLAPAVRAAGSAPWRLRSI